jgi:uncharacterized membrane protein
MKFMAPRPDVLPWGMLLLMLFVATYIFATITPAFQAPDEFDHVRRAYMLGHGQLLLQQMDGTPSGGAIDSGLDLYMQKMYPLGITPAKRMNADEKTATASIHWSGVPVRVYPSGTAYYFPAMYLPHAAGLRAGEMMGWSVSASYHLARFLVLICSLALLALGFRIYPPPPLAMALLSLPMGMFLLSSVVLDGISTAMMIVALSSFMRIITDREASSPRIVMVLLVSVGLVVSCRTNILPFLALPFAAWFQTRRRRDLICAAAMAGFVVAWTAFTIKFTVYLEGPMKADHAGRLVESLLHPLHFIELLSATVTDRPLLLFYAWSFVGILGWLTAAFTPAVYVTFGWLLILLLVLSTASRKVLTHQPAMRILLVLCAAGAVLLTFLALLVQWVQPDPKLINGVQGRYFTIPALAVTYAIGAWPGLMSGWRMRCATLLVVVVMGLGIFNTAQLLIARYYMGSLPFKQSHAPEGTRVEASSQLSAKKVIPIRFDGLQQANPRGLAAVSLEFATYQRVNRGVATLRLWTSAGEVSTFDVDLDSLEDNAYRSFALDGKPFIAGEIVSRGGVGVSLWEARGPDDAVVSCMKYTPVEGPAVVTAGCRLP